MNISNKDMTEPREIVEALREAKKNGYSAIVIINSEYYDVEDA